MNKRQIVVGAVIVDSMSSPTRVLAARRSSGTGQWEFPGGKVEPGESPEQALRREIDEELSVRILIGAELGDGVGWPINESLVLRLFVAVVEDGEPTPGADHSEVRWLTAGDLGAVDWLPSDAAAIGEVRSTLLASRDSVGPRHYCRGHD